MKDVSLYAPLAATLLAAISASVRSAAPAGGFWHSRWGAAILSLIGAAVGAASSAIALHGFDVHAIVMAISGAIGSLVGTWNPSIAKDGTSKLPIVFLALLALGASACTPTQAYVNALKTKGSVSDTLLGAYQAWRVYDAAKQDAIIAAAPDAPTAAAQLKAWRSDTQSKVDDAFVVAEKAVATYSIALSAVGVARQNDFTDAIANVLAAVSELLSTLKAAGVNVPTLPVTQRDDAPMLVADKDTGMMDMRRAVLGLARFEAERQLSRFYDQLCDGRWVARAPLCRLVAMGGAR